jgi:hypothetical protein
MELIIQSDFNVKGGGKYSWHGALKVSSSVSLWN